MWQAWDEAKPYTNYQPVEDDMDSWTQTHLEGNDQVDGFSHFPDVFGSQMARKSDFRMLWEKGREWMNFRVQ